MYIHISPVAKKVQGKLKKCLKKITQYCIFLAQIEKKRKYTTIV